MRCLGFELVLVLIVLVIELHNHTTFGQQKLRNLYFTVLLRHQVPFLALFAWFISRTFSDNEQYFFLTINQ